MAILTQEETPFNASEGSEIAGEIVAWDLTDPRDRGPKGGLRISLTQLKEALESAGLDVKEARDKEPRDAFARAAKRMMEKQIIRKIPNGHDEDQIRVQFTDEFQHGDGLGYKRDAVVTLNVKSGAVQCEENPEKGRFIETLLREEMGMRTGADVIAIAHRILMKGDIDLFPIRWKGGAYFVRAKHLGEIDKIEHYFKQLDIKMFRWPIVKGTARGDASIADTIMNGLDDQIADLKEAINDLSLDSRPTSFGKLAENINDQRHKVNSYSDFLGVLQDQLNDALNECDDKLNMIIGTIVAGEDPNPEKTAEKERKKAEAKAKANGDESSSDEAEVLTEAGAEA